MFEALAFGFIEITAFVIFFILLVVGTALDRRHQEGPKWWILGLGAVIACSYFWKDLSWTDIWATVQSWAFWKPTAIYLAAGVAYSVLEFILSVRKMARAHSEGWGRFIKITKELFTVDGDAVDAQWVTKRGDKYFVKGTNNRSNMYANDSAEKEAERSVYSHRDVILSAQKDGASAEEVTAGQKLVTHYLRSDEYILSDLKKDFIHVEMDGETKTIQPVINRRRLSAFIGAWTFLWPAYAVSLLIGDFLVEIFRILGDIFSKMGGRFVRFSFAGVFKV